MRRRKDDRIYSDDATYERAVRYSRTREWFALVDLVIGAVLSVLALQTGLSARLRAWIERLCPQQLGPYAAYSGIAVLVSTVITLPLSYVRGFVIEHRYGLSNQSRRGWFLEQAKGMAVSLVLLLPLTQGAYWIMRRFRRYWFAVFAALTIPFSIILTNLAPVLLLPLFNTFTPLENARLARRVKELAEEQGVHVSDVLQMDMSKQTKTANAFFTGLGNTRRIVLGDTMLEEFTADEIEVVLAHELGHQVHGDLWKLIALQVPLTLYTFYITHRLFAPTTRRFGERWKLDEQAGPADVAALPLLSLLMGGASFVAMPALNAISRRFIEHRADAYALELTGKREAFIGAMKKLGRMNMSDPKPPAPIKYLFYSHPPLNERVAFARSYRSTRG